MSYTDDLIRAAELVIPFSDDANLIRDLVREVKKAQPRIITTYEELKTLTDGAQIQDGDPSLCEREDGRWFVAGLEGIYPDRSLTLPVTVLFDPLTEVSE